jgi:hypothetical protein
MKLDEILTIMQNRLITLSESKKVALISGDVARVSEIDADIVSTTVTIDQIKEILNK